jgi:hypothetical protein
MYAEAIVLWIAGTHFFEWSNIFPKLLVTSPEPNCGKSTLMKVMRFLCPNAHLISRASEAALRRRIKQADGQIITLLLDDAENFVDESHTSLLNVGFDRYGGSFSFCKRDEQGNFEPEDFDVYVPIALGRIGTIKVESTKSRCIEINLQRAKPGELQERFEPDQIKDLLDEIRNRLREWALHAGPSLKGQDPQMPAELVNRDADIWRFLFSIADLAGGRWPEVARDAARAITLNASDKGSGQEFRHALQQALKLAHDQEQLAARRLARDNLGISQIAEGNLRISSDGLCKLLKAVTPGQIDLKTPKLAERLKPFDISPAPIKVGGKVLRGYKEEDLREMLDRYGAGEQADWEA